MKRKDFLKYSAMGAGALLLPDYMLKGNPIDPAAMLEQRLDVSQKKELADVALNAAKSSGASYADIRIGRYLNQFVVTREKNVQGVVNSESFGVGIRVLADGRWGFASTDKVTKDEVAATAKLAVAIAKANAKITGKPVELAEQKGYGEVSWKSPIEKNYFEVPVQEKVDFLMGINDAALAGGASFVNSGFRGVNEQKYFASTDGSYIDQDIHRFLPNFNVTKVDRASGQFVTRASLSTPVGMSYEYLFPKESEKVKGVVTRYKNRYDMMEDVKGACLDIDQKMKAKSVEPGKYDLVLDPTHLWLTIHETVGHPTELDRVLGYEANFAGTSYMTFDKWESKKFAVGSEIVNFTGDKTEVGSAGAVGWDDEGVACKKWDIIKDGILVSYQAIRDQAHLIGLKESQGCCYSQSWEDVQFQRMPNVSLKPGKKKMSVDDMIKGVQKGIYIIGDGSYSIDHQRYNFQFSGQTFYEIKNGKLGGMLKDVAYQGNSQEFWNSCVNICDESDYRMGGTFGDGKGQPSQSNCASHGCSTAQFKGVNVLNIGRNIG